MKDLLVGHGRTVRVGSWRGDDSVASVATFIDQPLDPTAVRLILNRLRSDGYGRIITAALTPDEQHAFVENGFVPLRELVLLRRPLDDLVPRPDHGLRRWRRRRFDAVLAIDEAAFDSFWRFDEVALKEALAATPVRTLRVNSGGPPTGYALSGVARGRGYLQRLAVHPETSGSGLGTALLLDALVWMRARGAADAYVNTQDNNDRALELYSRHGFVVESDGLTMLHREL